MDWPERRALTLVSLGSIAEPVLQEIELALKENLPVNPTRGPELEVPALAWDPQREQYRAEQLLTLLVKRGPELVLGVTAVDIFTPGLNFVFGLAAPPTHTALVSLYRLQPEFYNEPADPQLFYKRARKEAVHEIGHLLGLSHCPDPECVMSFANSILDVDRKGEQLCARCRAKLRRLH